MNYRKTNRGLIWSNERKNRDAQPDFKGSLSVKGEEFWISAWKQDGGEKPGLQSLSFTVRPKDEAIIEQPKDYVVSSDNRSGDSI
ncbi:MAG: hypothetical protein OEN02_04725 [Gammaproteobacteria bacterium]|nr:hypothetical protein [Gammaproteobacteria bacterium]MDH3537242.1 hypothetical protein [Gammaproteobacteria bacterium]